MGDVIEQTLRHCGLWEGPMVASPQRKRRASCSWCSILNFFKAGRTEVFSYRDSRFSLRYAPSGHSKALNQRRKSDLGTVFVLPGPKIGKTTPHRPRDVCLPSVQVQRSRQKAAGQVEAADGFQYSWRLTGDSNHYQSFFGHSVDAKSPRR